MNSLLVATSFTQGYPWAEACVRSIVKHAPHECAIYAIDHQREDAITIPRPETRLAMAQHGSFLEAMPYWIRGLEDPLIVFCDADLVMQRPFTIKELTGDAWDWQREPYVWLGPNRYLGELLRDEMLWIQPMVTGGTIDQLFPGWSEMEVRNCGVIVAKASTYRRLYDFVRALLPACYACFGGVTAIQWLICYCVQRWLKLRLLPRTIHVHGHVDPGPEVTYDAEGNALVNGKMAVFRHALNLDPEKSWSSEEWKERRKSEIRNPKSERNG